MLTMRTSAGLDERRKRALLRTWRRGTRELDIIFGLFANSEIESMSEADLTELERLLDCEDPNLQKWFMGQAPVLPEFDTMLFARIVAFRSANPIG
ncbi:MAG: succinate dehydrogenase assembly factor 2 [Notoacmeibacter sp.]